MAINVPSFAPSPSEHLKLATTRINCFNDIVELDRFLTMLVTALDALHAIEKLFHIWLTCATRADVKQFMPDTVVVSHVVPDLIPYEGRFICEAPGVHDIECFFQHRRRDPQKEHCIVF